MDGFGKIFFTRGIKRGFGVFLEMERGKFGLRRMGREREKEGKDRVFGLRRRRDDILNI